MCNYTHIRIVCLLAVLKRIDSPSFISVLTILTCMHKQRYLVFRNEDRLGREVEVSN